MFCRWWLWAKDCIGSSWWHRNWPGNHWSSCLRNVGEYTYLQLSSKTECHYHINLYHFTFTFFLAYQLNVLFSFLPFYLDSVNNMVNTWQHSFWTWGFGWEFLFHAQTEAFCSTYNIDLFVVVYSVVDRNSFKTAEKVLQYLKESEMLMTRGAILVGNKTDLERHREINRQSKYKILVL